MPRPRRCSPLAAATLAAAAALCAGGVAGADPLRAAFRVVGTAPMAAGLRTCIDQRLRAAPGYVLVDKLPVVELLVYANTDVDDDVNARGVTIGIAYLDHGDAIRLAKSLLIGDHPSTDPAVHAAMVDLMASGGELDRLNVVHVGTPGEAATRDVCTAVVDDFFRKFPTGAKPAAAGAATGPG